MRYYFEAEPRLPFPTKTVLIHGQEIEEYIIPEDKKTEVLSELFFGDETPSLDEQRFDLHSGKLFVVRDFRVTREHNRNWVVSPYYEDGGGTAIDWMPAEWANPEEDDSEEDYIDE